jgi:hypothetical protein
MGAQFPGRVTCTAPSVVKGGIKRDHFEPPLEKLD